MKRLACAVAFAFATAAASRAQAQFAPDFPPPDGPGKLTPPEPPADEKPDSPGAPPRDVVHLALGAGGHVGLGVAPGWATGAQVSAELATPRWSLGLEARYDAPSSGDTTSGARARAWLIGGAFIPCARAKALWACGVVSLSHVSTSGSYDEGGSQGSAKDGWVVLGLGARMALHFPLKYDFALRIVGEAQVHPLPWDLTQNGHVLYKSSVVSTTIGPALVHAF